MPIPTGIGIWYNSNSMPGGWARDAAQNDRMVKGAAANTNAETGGATSHNHSTPQHTHPQSQHTHNYTTGAPNDLVFHAGSWMSFISHDTHTHTGTTGNSAPSVGSSGQSSGASFSSPANSNMPPYYSMVYIESQGTAIGYPAGAVVFWTDNSAIPTGWSRHSDTYDKYILGAASGANEGATGGGSHTHDLAAHTHAAGAHTHAAATSDASTNNNDWAYYPISNYPKALLPHVHTVTPDASSGSGTSSSNPGGTVGAYTAEPTYYVLITIENTSGADSWLEDAIVMWDGAHDEGTIADWARCDGTAASPDLRGKFIRGASSNGSNVNATGGAAGHTNHNAASHSHNASHSHPYPATSASSSNQIASYGQWAQWTASGNHGHPAGTTDNDDLAMSSQSNYGVNAQADSQPSFRTVIYLRTPSEPAPNVPFFGANF